MTFSLDSGGPAWLAAAQTKHLKCLKSTRLLRFCHTRIYSAIINFHGYVLEKNLCIQSSFGISYVGVASIVSKI